MRGIVISFMFHTLVVLAVAMGLPHFHKKPDPSARPVTVDVVRLADITRASKGEKPKPKPKKTPDADRDTTKKPVAKDQASKQAEVKPKAEPAKPKPAQRAEPRTRPEPKIAEQPKQPVARPTPARPESKAKAQPKQVEIDPRALKRRTEKPPKKKEPERKQARGTPKPKPKPKTTARKPDAKPKARIAARPRLRPTFKRKTVSKTKPKKKQIAERPKAKPKPTAKPKKRQIAKRPVKKKKPKNALDSVFKSVRRMKDAARKESDRDRTAKRQPRGQKNATRSAPMTLSEIDSVRQQIKPCWNFPTGARNASALRVLIKVWLRRDGSVLRAQVMDRARMSSDPYFRAAAEAGRRAVENPRCSPLKLPAEKYDRWKELIIDFDPSKLRTG